VIRRNTIRRERIKASEDSFLEKFPDGTKGYLIGKIFEMNASSLLMVTPVLASFAHSFQIKRR